MSRRMSDEDLRIARAVSLGMQDATANVAMAGITGYLWYLVFCVTTPANLLTSIIIGGHDGAMWGWGLFLLNIYLAIKHPFIHVMLVIGMVVYAASILP